MWEGLVQKAKDGGLDVIDTYVFWNVHEPSPGKVCHFLQFCQDTYTPTHIFMYVYLISNKPFVALGSGVLV